LVEEQVFTRPTQEEIDAQATPFLSACIHLWLSCKRWQLPNGSIGHDNERATVMEIINLLESESNAYDAWDWEQKHPSKE